MQTWIVVSFGDDGDSSTFFGAYEDKDRAVDRLKELTKGQNGSIVDYGKHVSFEKPRGPMYQAFSVGMNENVAIEI